MSEDEIITRNQVKITGRGKKPVVFAAGFGCDQQMWRFVAPAFEEDYRVILFDYVGAGKTDLKAYDPQKYSHLSGYAQDVLEVVSALKLEQATFVGHSVSCMIGLLASIQQPTLFERLIMIGPSPCYLNELPEYSGGFRREDLEELLEMMEHNFLGWANYLAPVIMGNADRPELTEEIHESFCSTDPVIARNFARATFFGDNRGDLPRAKVPSLILQCAEDAIASTLVGEYVHRHMPLSTLWYMKATGHCPHLSHPKETIELIQQYLKAESGSPSRTC